MTRALIIGGGVAGPVAAMALQRAGIEPVVYEARSRPTKETGSYLTVATNGLDALRAIGADRRVLAAGFSTPHIVLLSGTGKVLGRVPVGGALSDGTVSITIKRARLHAALHEQLSARGIAVEFEKRLAGVELAPDGGVEACFEDGTRAGGDLLIGCDGIRSITRRIIDPGAPAGRYVGLVNFGGYTRRAPHRIEPGEWRMVFGRRAFFGYVADPGGGVVWFANVPRPEVTPTERQRTTAEQWKQQLIELFRPDNSPATNLIEGGELELMADNTYDLPTVPTWRRGPMVIIGDAAHAPSPTSGQGASMAMEDAVVLAKCLRDVPEIPRALEMYERLRRHRVERIVAAGARQSSNKTAGRVARILRDLMLPLVFKYLVTEKSMAWMFNHHIDWDTPVRAAAAEAAQAA